MATDAEKLLQFKHNLRKISNEDLLNLHEVSMMRRLIAHLYQEQLFVRLTSIKHY